MSYQVIARRTRPQSFDDLKGQSTIRQTLTNAIENNRLHHALLFNGPRGTGKTSTARILAKTLRCTNLQENHTPCNECHDCVEITNGRSLDVLEIDGASNNGVDSIRELRDRVGFHASSGSKKIYIIDEVHMLSTSAFNALLKTLEEPPEGVYFMMATTELHKLPKTILSRCQRYDFKPVGVEEVKGLLKKICDEDKITYEEDALFLLAQAGEGCVRDSYSFLDQCITFSNGNLTAKLVRETLGITDISFFTDVLEALLKKENIGEVLKKISESSIDPQIFMEDLVKHVKNLTLTKISQENMQQNVSFTEIEKETYLNLSSLADLEDLFILFDICFKGTSELLRAFDPRVLLEITLMKAASAPFYKDLGSSAGPQTPVTTRSSSSSSAPQSNYSPRESIEALTKPKNNTGNAKQALNTEPAKQTQVANEVNQSQSTPASWSEFVKKIKGLNAVIGAKLEMCAYSFDKENKTLKISEGEKASFLKEQLKSDEFLNPLKNYVRAFWGPEYNAIYVAKTETQDLKKSHVVQKEHDAIEKKTQAQTDVENHDVIKEIQKKHKIKITNIRET